LTASSTLALLIPAYNAAATLPRLLKSAAAQTEPFDQIWVYDDCSTDDSAAVAEAFGASVLRGEINKGCSAGKNALARAVKADWLHFHDADDALLPNFVNLCRSWMKDARFDVVMFDYEWRDDQTGELLGTRSFDDKQLRLDPRRYAIQEQINPFCGLYRRSSYDRVGGYDEDPHIIYNEDVAFHIKLAFAGLSFAAENSVSIINYRRGGSMSSANSLKCLQAQLEVMARTLVRPDAKLYYNEIASRLWAIAGALGAHADWPSADRAIMLAKAICPVPPSAGSKSFRLLARVHSKFALRMRASWKQSRREGTH
jgi:glycosyltransferase involved in cell wall biosynthesis